MSANLPESGDFKPVVDTNQPSKENVPLETPPTSYVGRTVKFLKDATNAVIHIFGSQVGTGRELKGDEHLLSGKNISVKQKTDNSFPSPGNYTYGLGLGGETVDYDPEIHEEPVMYLPVGSSSPESPSPRYSDTVSAEDTTSEDFDDYKAMDSEKLIGKLQKQVDSLTGKVERLKEENASLEAGDDAFDTLLEEYVQHSNNLTSEVARLREKRGESKEAFTTLLVDYIELSNVLGAEVSHLKERLSEKEKAQIEVQTQKESVETPSHPVEASVLFAPPPPPPPPPGLSSSVIEGGAPPPPPPPSMGPTASTKALPLTYPKAKALLKPVFDNSIGKIMDVDSVKYLASSQNPEEIRRQIAESILRQIFDDHKGVLESDLNEAVSPDKNITPKRSEGQVLRVLFNDILSKPAALLCASKFTSESMPAEEVVVKKEAKKELDISSMIPTVVLYLNSRGDPQKSITAMFEKKEPIPPLYGKVKFAVKDFCMTKLGYDEGQTKAIINDPAKLFAHYEQKLKEDAKTAVVQLHSRGITIPEANKDAVYAKALEKVSSYLDVRDPKTKTDILSDPIKVLETYREISLLELFLFDRGIDPKSLLQQKASSISTDLEKVKNKIIYEKMKKDGKADPAEVSDYVYNMSHFLEGYQDMRHDVSSIPTVDKRAKESYPYALGDKTYSDAVEKLNKGEFPKSLKLYFSDTFTPSDKLLNKLYTHFHDADQSVKSNILSALSPFQQLWLLEVAKGPGQQFIAEFMANQTFNALQIGSTASSEAKDSALKLLVYLKENHAKAKPDQKEAYELLFSKIQNQRGYPRIKAYL